MKEKILSEASNNEKFDYPIALASLDLPAEKYPLDENFKVQTHSEFPMELTGFTLAGYLGCFKPVLPGVKESIELFRNSGRKLILLDLLGHH